MVAKNKVILITSLWACVTVFVFGLAFYSLDGYKHLYLLEYGVEDVGKVTRIEYDNRVIHFNYSVDNVEYTDQFTATTVTGSFIGKELKVTYDKSNPKYYLGGNVWDSFRGLIVVSSIFGMIPSLFFSFIFFKVFIKTR